MGTGLANARTLPRNHRCARPTGWRGTSGFDVGPAFCCPRICENSHVKSDRGVRSGARWTGSLAGHSSVGGAEPVRQDGEVVCRSSGSGHLPSPTIARAMRSAT